MNLRYYQTYDKYGCDSPMELQLYNAEYETWETIPYVREKEGEHNGE